MQLWSRSIDVSSGATYSISTGTPTHPHAGGALGRGIKELMNGGSTKAGNTAKGETNTNVASPEKFEELTEGAVASLHGGGGPTTSTDPSIIGEATPAFHGKMLPEVTVTANANPSNNMLDNFQTALDVGGIADPFGVADLTNAIIYACRGRWGDASISALGIVPYIGDAGKLGRLGAKGASYARLADTRYSIHI